MVGLYICGVSQTAVLVIVSHWVEGWCNKNLEKTKHRQTSLNRHLLNIIETEMWKKQTLANITNILSCQGFANRRITNQ